MATSIISRANARAAGLKRFFTGNACKHGHIAERMVSSGQCVGCFGWAYRKRKSYYADLYRRTKERIKALPTAERDALRKTARASAVRRRATLGSAAWRNALLCGARERARQRGWEFDEEAVRELLTNPPTHCPVLGLKFQPGNGTRRLASPSIDRIRNDKGYVRGNIALISLHANRIKTSATASEIIAVGKWLQKQLDTPVNEDQSEFELR